MGNRQSTEDQRRQAGTNMAALCSWAARTEFEHIPETALRRAVAVIGDNLGAIVASRDEPEVALAQTRILEAAHRPEATVFRGGCRRAERTMAAVANGIAGNGAQLDPGYPKVPCHAGLYIVPALLAEAEATNIPVSDILRAVVISFEITTRVARCWPLGTEKLYPAAVFCSLGAAAAVGVARRLSSDALLGVLGAAATLVHVGPFQHSVNGLLVCNAWAGSGAWCGMMAVDWAGMGFSGTGESLHDVYTVALGTQAQPMRLVEGLGEEWAIEDSFHKPYSSCQYTHSAIETSLALYEELPAHGLPDAIAQIAVEASSLALSLDNDEPENGLATRFSIQHAVAAPLVLGHARPEAFGSAALASASIRSLRRKITLRKFEPTLPPPHDRPARITITLDNGERITRQCLSSKGGPDRPYSDEDLFARLHTWLAPVYPRLAPRLHDLGNLGRSDLQAGWDAFLSRMIED